MVNYFSKGGSGVRVSDVMEYLEYKILSDECTDQEYGLYIEAKKYDEDEMVKELRYRLIKWYRSDIDEWVY